MHEEELTLLGLSLRKGYVPHKRYRFGRYVDD
jgi:hypothetical protein